jgi:hypothetical protein
MTTIKNFRAMLQARWLGIEIGAVVAAETVDC